MHISSPINNAPRNICPVYDKGSAYFCIEVVIFQHESYMFNTVRHFDNEAAFLPFHFFSRSPNPSPSRPALAMRAPFFIISTMVLRLHMYVHMLCLFILDA